MTMHYTEEEMAYLMGVTLTTISRWENGSRVPNVYDAIGLSVVTKRLVDELFSDYRHEWIKKSKKRAEALSRLKILRKNKGQKNRR
jgi:transcriptional regulator with XRE-family HTH domain